MVSKLIMILLTFEVYTEASSSGIGAVLSQKYKASAYASDIQ